MSGINDDDNGPTGDGHDRGDVSGAPGDAEPEEDPVGAADDREASPSHDSGIVDEELYGRDDDDDDDVEGSDVEDEGAADASDVDSDDGFVSDSDEEDFGGYVPGVRDADDLSSAALLLRQIMAANEDDDDSPNNANAVVLQRLFVNLGTPPSIDLGRYWRDFPGHFRSFVTELERCHRINSIDLQHANFAEGGWGQGADAAGGRSDRGGGPFRVDLALQPRTDDLDRLFGTVLPRHPSLKNISIDESWIQPRCVRLLAESVAAHPAFNLKMLAFENTPLTLECGQFLKSMLQHNVRLRELRLHHCGLGAEGLRRVCEGAGANEHLAVLSFREGDVVVPPGTVVATVAPMSKLKCIFVHARSWSREAFVEFVSTLRANLCLVYSYLGQDDEFTDAHLVHDLLHTYNFSLASITLGPTWRGRNVSASIGALLHRNKRVRCVVDELEAADYRVSCQSAWPLALQEISTFPTLLYRFLRKGNLGDLALHLEQKAIQNVGRDQLTQLTDS